MLRGTSDSTRLIVILPGTATPGTVRESRVVLDRPGRRVDGSPLWPSDHYGVLAEISFAPAPAEARLSRPDLPSKRLR